MRLSPGALIVCFIFAVALLFSASAFAPVQAAGSGMPGGNDPDALSSIRNIYVSEDSNGQSLVADRNDVLVVRLPESGPDRAWQYDGNGGFVIVGDTTPQAYPGDREFRAKVLWPGDLRFRLTDHTANNTFSVHVAIRESSQESVRVSSHPLSW